MVLGALSLALCLGLPIPGATAAPNAPCPEAGDLPVIGGIELSDPDDLIERNVISADGQWVGTVEDVTLDNCGTPATIVVSVGANRGPSKHVAIAIDRVRFRPNGDALRIDGMTRAEIAVLPPVDDAGSAMSLHRRNPHLF